MAGSTVKHVRRVHARRCLARSACGVVLTLLIAGAGAAAPAQKAALAQESAFPFDSELFLDARPMAGSKRIPNMDVSARGAVAIEMWCNRVEGQVVVAGDTITILLGAPTSRSCSLQETEGDASLLAALNAVTNWRREGDMLILSGPTTLRFKAPTH